MVEFFEQGPIRPPSEARSLLLRLTRNCPWNQCTFCPVYKGAKFSRRTVSEIKGDIDLIYDFAETIRALSWQMGEGGRITSSVAERVFSGALGPNQGLKYIAFWLYSGGKHAFLQDANSLIMKPADVAEVIGYLKEKFPEIDRITTYARSATVARMEAGDLAMLKDTGLTRVHIGLESGSDEVLAFMKKGVSAKQHIEGGRRVKEAALELSEYIMPGLGGRRLSEIHALETARVINAINPHFVRLRTLHVHDVMPLSLDVMEKRFEIASDDEIVKEIRIFIENLSDITSTIVSDHILNLLPEVFGTLPEDKDTTLSVIDRYLSLDKSERLLYKVGRRAGFVESLSDLTDERVRLRASAIIDRLGIDGDGDEERMRELMNGYI